MTNALPGPEFRERVRAHLLMQLQAAYDADPALRETPKAEVWAALTDRLAASQLEAAWREWLAGQRRCASIVFVDRTTAMPLEASEAC